MSSVCIVIPAYNEEVAIAQTIREYKRAFPDSRLVVVDNNSGDKTSDRARAELGPNDLILYEAKRGKGNAVRTGLGRVSADIYILVDGDGTYPAEDARRMLNALERNRCDMVIGDRLSGGAYSKQNTRAGHSAGNRFLTSCVSLLAGQRFNDVMSGLRVMSRPFVNMLDVRSTGFQLETELNVTAAYLRAQVIEVPIQYLARPDGSESKLDTARDGLRIVWFALLNWIAFYPLQAFGLLAIISLSTSFILGLFVFVAYLRLGAMPYPSTAVAAAASGLVGVQAIFSGMILRISGRNERRQSVARLIEMRREWNAQLDLSERMANR